MNYLTALLAFSAIMIVLATLTTVVVEAVHGLTKRRTNDFDEMLQKLYTDAVKPRLENALGHVLDETSERFSAHIRRNPAFDENKFKFIKTAFNKLTTRQFVEQFAHTKAGKELSGKADDVVKTTISELAYEFERFGDAASDYFQRRATALSLVAAVVMALTLNVDAIALFSALASDNSLSEGIVAELNIGELEETYKKSIENGDNKEAIDKAYAEVREQIRASTAQLSGLGIPIGLHYFPFCVASGRADGDRKDVRCTVVTAVTPKSGDQCGALCGWLHSAGTTSKRIFSTPDGIGWLVSVLIAGGLIGLGAPFWFKTYQFIAAFVPGIKLPDSTQARQKSGTKTVSPPADNVLNAAPAHPAAVSATGLTESDLAEAFVKSRRQWSASST